MTPPLQTTGLGKQYGRNWALRDCSLSLPEGRVIALVGPNGAGKTTLLEMAVGLVEPTTGSVSVLGRPSAGWGRAHPGVGYVSQELALYRSFTIDDLLRMGVHMNREFDRGWAVKRLAELGIPVDRRAGKLSGGQQAQVALTLALAKHPELVILDEPLAGLDPLARKDFMSLVMTASADDESTIVFSSHMLAELERVCDYLVVLAHGRLQVSGDIEELRATHHRLLGPRGAPHPAGVTVLAESQSGRQTSLVVRSGTSAYPKTLESAYPQAPESAYGRPWETAELELEDIVLTYMRNPDSALLPRPSLAASEIAS